MTFGAARCASTACRSTRSLAGSWRRLHIDTSPPHAFLEPLRTPAGLPNANELDGVMSLMLDRKETKNALSVRMVGEIRESIAKVASTSKSRILLVQTPHTGAFCSGADLRERRSMSPSQVSSFLDSLRAMITELESLKIPTIAVLDGIALGGGLELALGCDIRVGGRNTSVALPETKLGIIPGAGGTQRLTQLVGRSKAMELIFSGRRVAGDEALRIGLVNILAQSPHDAIDEAILLCRQILTSAPLALGAAKAAINAAPHLTIEEGLDLERKLYNPLLDTEDRQEGLKAFAEKRRAQFLGR